MLYMQNAEFQKRLLTAQEPAAEGPYRVTTRHLVARPRPRQRSDNLPAVAR